MRLRLEKLAEEPETIFFLQHGTKDGALKQLADQDDLSLKMSSSGLQGENG